MAWLFWLFFFFSSRRRHTRCSRDWSSDVCSSDLLRHERLSSLYVCRRMLVIFVLRSEQSEIGVDERHLGSGPRFGAPPAWAKNTVSGKKCGSTPLGPNSRKLAPWGAS